MNLYYAPGACSLAPHIVMREAGFPVELKKVDLKAKQFEGGDYKSVNGKGYVPAVKLDDGTVLTEAPVIMQYLADQKPDAGLAPKAGSMDRYRLQEWLNFITSELHKGMGNFFNPALTDDWRKAVTDRLGLRFDWLSKQLEGKKYLMGDKFTVADAYLFVVLNWAGPSKFDMGKWPVLQEYHKRVAARPKVQEALKAEGLVK
ncbi:MAG TPA: glutathione transferase GstA [Burkholderiales bacterium]|nr:glutathione transferase GstA [Burkholderiales bacterium]